MMHGAVADWLGTDGLTDQEKTDLFAALEWSSDGYKAASELDRRSWVPDSELVGILDGFSTYTAQREAWRDWRANNTSDLDPLAPAVGDVVRVNIRGAVEAGEVVSVDDDVAQCTVFFPQMGHVREGIGTKGRIFGWEDLLR